VRRLAAVAVVPLLLAAGCGSHSTPAEKATSDTARKLGTIHSGQLQFKLVTGAGETPADNAADEVGFSLQGPFALAAPGALPVAQIDYTRLAGGSQTKTQIISTGTKAFVGIGAKVYELPPAQVDSLRAPKNGKADDGLSGLRIDRWVKHPQLSAGDQVDGAATERIQGQVDGGRPLHGLFAFRRQVRAPGLAVPEIKGSDADQLRRVTQAATVDLMTGTDDHLLRTMTVDIRLAAQVPERVKASLGELAAAHIRFDLAIGQPNTPVHVAEPQGALPASAIPRAA